MLKVSKVLEDIKVLPGPPGPDPAPAAQGPRGYQGYQGRVGPQGVCNCFCQKQVACFNDKFSYSSTGYASQSRVSIPYQLTSCSIRGTLGAQGGPQGPQGGIFNPNCLGFQAGSQALLGDLSTLKSTGSTNEIIAFDITYPGIQQLGKSPDINSYFNVDTVYSSPTGIPNGVYSTWCMDVVNEIGDGYYIYNAYSILDPSLLSSSPTVNPYLALYESCNSAGDVYVNNFPAILYLINKSSTYESTDGYSMGDLQTAIWTLLYNNITISDIPYDGPLTNNISAPYTPANVYAIINDSVSATYAIANPNLIPCMFPNPQMGLVILPTAANPCTQFLLLQVQLNQLSLKCCGGCQGPQGARGFQGFQGLRGPDHLYVERTAYVDIMFASSTPAVEDESNPFPSITAAIAAIELADPNRGPGDIWRIVARPGNYSASVEVNGYIATAPYIDIYGSGPSTIITVPIEAYLGPCTLSDVNVQLVNQSSISIGTTLRIQNSRISATTPIAGLLRNHRSGLQGVPSQGFPLLAIAAAPNPTDIHLTVTNCDLSITGSTDQTTFTSSCIMLVGSLAGVSNISVFTSDLRCYAYGKAPSVLAVEDGASTTNNYTLTNSTYTIYNIPSDLPDGASSIRYDIYYFVPNNNSSVPFNVLIDDLSHTIYEPVGIIATDGNTNRQILFEVGTSTTSQITMRDSFIEFVPNPNNGFNPTLAPIYSAYNYSGASNVLSLVDTKWVGPTNIPQILASSDQVSGFPSGPIQYLEANNSGTLVSTGGQQTGWNSITTSTYTLSSSDFFVIYNGPEGGQITLPAPAYSTTSGSSTFYFPNALQGKLVDIYNNTTSPVSIIAYGWTYPNGPQSPQGRLQMVLL